MNVPKKKRRIISSTPSKISELTWKTLTIDRNMSGLDQGQIQIVPLARP